MEYAWFLLGGLLAAVPLDLALGDPPNRLHPVAWMGSAIRALVRDCASFGLPSCIRLATRRPQENARLLEAIDRLLGQREGEQR